MKKFPAVLISDGSLWNVLFSTINFDCLELVALYGDIDQFNLTTRQKLEVIFHPIECFGKECKNYKDTYFIFNCFGDKIRGYLGDCGIDRQYIISLEYPEPGNFRMLLTYYAQWKFLKRNKPAIDFFTTGISFTRDGFDVSSMLPYKGITLAFLMQDMYYSYKMAQAYLSNCIPVNTDQSIKFCIMGLAPYQFQLKLCHKSLNYDEIIYIPILGHDEMEYKDTKRGNFLREILSSKYFRILEDFELSEINFSDIDGQRAFLAQDSFKISTFERLDLENEYRIYRKKYPETVEFNLKCLEDYLNLLHKHNIVPFGVLFPFSVPGRRAYPAESVREFRDLLFRFKDKMQFIDLWDMNLPNSNYRNVSHLNISGSKITTFAIKKAVDAYFGNV